MITIVVVLAALAVGTGVRLLTRQRGRPDTPRQSAVARRMEARLLKLDRSRQRILMERELSPFRLGSGRNEPPGAIGTRGDYP